MEAKEFWNDAKAIEKKTAYQSEERFVRVGSIGKRSGQKSLLSESETSDSSRVRRARPEVNDSSTKTLPLTAEEFDSRFDEGASVFDLGFSKEGLTRPGLVSKRFNVDVPAHMLQKLDDAAMTFSRDDAPGVGQELALRQAGKTIRIKFS